MIKTNLNEKGYVVIPNILTPEDVSYVKEIFNNWKDNIPCHDKIHYKTDPHGIYKTLEAGHQRHAWYIRTRHQIQEVFFGIQLGCWQASRICPKLASSYRHQKE